MDTVSFVTLCQIYPFYFVFLFLPDAWIRLRNSLHRLLPYQLLSWRNKPLEKFSAHTLFFTCHLSPSYDSSKNFFRGGGGGGVSRNNYLSPRKLWAIGWHVVTCGAAWLFHENSSSDHDVLWWNSFYNNLNNL